MLLQISLADGDWLKMFEVFESLRLTKIDVQSRNQYQLRWAFSPMI